MLHTKTLNVPWRPMFSIIGPRDQDPERVAFREKLQGRLQEELTKWIGTPYMLSSQEPGPQGGARCTSFVCGVLDGLRGTHTELEVLPADISAHDAEGARAAMRRLIRMYAPARNVLRDGWLEPGDILVTGPAGGGPGHGMIVGPEPNTLWQCIDPLGVEKTGWGLLADLMVLHGVYRLSNRSTWK